MVPVCSMQRPRAFTGSECPLAYNIASSLATCNQLTDSTRETEGSPTVTVNPVCLSSRIPLSHCDFCGLRQSVPGSETGRLRESGESEDWAAIALGSPDAHRGFSFVIQACDDLMRRPIASSETPGRYFVGTYPAGGVEDAAGNQLVVTDRESIHIVVHSCPKGRPGGAVPGRNAICTDPAGSVEFSLGSQPIIIDGESKDPRQSAWCCRR